MVINVPQSKDAFCDFLLARMWQTFLDEVGADSNADYDLTDDDECIDAFYRLFGKDKLKQFNINSKEDLQQYLKLAYHNLDNSDIIF